MRWGAAECTSLCSAAAPEDGQRVLLAQNWDWKPGARATCVLLVGSPHDAPAFVTLVEAGLLAKCGMNDAGIGLVTNALTSTLDRGEPGVPFHAILRRILTSGSFDEAVAAAATPVRASSANYLIASRDGRAADLEVTPGGAAGVHRTDGARLAHANHFLTSSREGFEDRERMDPSGSSAARQALADDRLRDPAGASIDGLLAALRDHTAPVCRHLSSDELPEAASETIAAVPMDLADGALWVTEGHPCTAAAERFELGSLVRDAA